MESISLNSHGKINLSLDIINKREDGYHNIETIMQEIDLKDKVSIKSLEKGIIIKSNNKEIPLDENNLVYSAWKLMQEESGLDKGVEIYIEKNIPISAGLAGGSGNAAAVLKGLNIIWDLGYDIEKLQEIGLKIGADIPFCLQGGTSFATGIGEKLERLPSFKNKLILLANLGIPVSSKEIYENLNIGKEIRKIDIKSKIDFILKDDIYGLGKNMNNIMEKVVFKKYNKLIEIKKTMIENGAVGALMSGSGPTIFGIYDSEEKILNSYNKLRENMEKVYITKTI